MLAVDRQKHTAAARLRGKGQLAGGDEAFLVRQRQCHAALECPEGRADAGEADDRVEDDVRLAPLEELDRVAADLDVLDSERCRPAQSSGVDRNRRAPAGARVAATGSR